MKTLALLVSMLIVAPISQASEWGHGNMTVFLSTGSYGTQTFYVGTGNSRAAGGSILGYVNISSAAVTGGSFEVYDSSTTDLTERTVLFGAVCTALQSYSVFIQAQYGLTLVSKVCTGQISYLTHK